MRDDWGVVAYKRGTLEPKCTSFFFKLRSFNLLPFKSWSFKIHPWKKIIQVFNQNNNGYLFVFTLCNYEERENVP